MPFSFYETKQEPSGFSFYGQEPEEELDWMARLGDYIRQKINLPEGASAVGLLENLGRELPGLIPEFGPSTAIPEAARGMGQQVAERIKAEEMEKIRQEQHFVPEKGEVPPGKAQYVAEQIPVAGVFPRTIREGAKTWYEEPARNIMDLAILVGGARGMLKGKPTEPGKPLPEARPVGKPKPGTIPEVEPFIEKPTPIKKPIAESTLPRNIADWQQRLSKLEQEAFAEIAATKGIPRNMVEFERSLKTSGEKGRLFSETVSRLAETAGGRSILRERYGKSLSTIITKKLRGSTTESLVPTKPAPTPKAPVEGKGISEVLKPYAEAASKLSKEEFLTKFNRGLKAQNSTQRETAQRVLAEIEKNGMTLESFYDASKLKSTPTPTGKAPTGKVAEPPVESPVTEPMKPPSGELKTRGLALSVEQRAIANNLTESFGDLPKYQTMNMKEQAQKATALMDADYAKAVRVAMGEEGAPAGLYPENVMSAVETRATMQGDGATLLDLATSSKLLEQATEMGQRIKSLDVGLEQRPVKAIQDINTIREKVVTKRLKNVDAIKKREVKIIRSKVAEGVGNEWNAFIQSIRC